MSTTLDENLNVISENESIEIEQMGDDLHIISKLDDEPNDVGGLTAAELKHEFDKAGLAIQKFLNESLIPKIVEEDATNAARETAEQARAQAETGRIAAEQGRVQAETDRVQAEKARNVWVYYKHLESYVPGNKVSYEGSSYVNIKACSGVAPDAENGDEYWVLLASRGKDGADIVGSAVNSEGHLILTYSDGSKVDCGAIASSIDWDEGDPAAPGYIRNRTHFREVLVKGGTVYPATAVNLSLGENLLIGVGTNEIAEGNTCIVTFGGLQYTCKAHPLNGFLALGNDGLNGGSDTGEPFLIYNMDSTTADILAEAAEEPVEVQIDVVEETRIHQLAPMWIKDMYYTESGGGLVEIPVSGVWDDEDGDGVGDGYYITAPVGLEIGKTYTVKWNGTEYACAAQEVADDEVTAVVLGDLYTYSGGSYGTAATGEPFAIADFGVDVGNGVYGMAVSLDGSGEVAFSIYQGGGEVVHQIPTKYLPDGVPYVIEGTEVEVLAKCQPTYDSSDGNFIVSGATALTAGTSYTVDWNGVEYVCTAQDLSALQAGYVGLGAWSAYGIEGNGEPFLIVYVGGGYLIVPHDGTTELTLAIRQGGAEIRKLDNRCLDWAAIYAILPDHLADGSAKGSVRTTSSAEEDGSYTMGLHAFAEGALTKASGEAAHAEGRGADASGKYSHAEGEYSAASGEAAHAEGGGKASGNHSHAEGGGEASGNYSHAEGVGTIASGQYSHAEGNWTVAASEDQHVQGRYNITDSEGKYAHVVGNGQNDSLRSNAHTLDWSGVGWFAGGLKVGGTGQDDAGAKDVIAVPPVSADDNGKFLRVVDGAWAAVALTDVSEVGA